MADTLEVTDFSALQKKMCQMAVEGTGPTCLRVQGSQKAQNFATQGTSGTVGEIANIRTKK